MVTMLQHPLRRAVHTSTCEDNIKVQQDQFYRLIQVIVQLIYPTRSLFNLYNNYYTEIDGVLISDHKARCIIPTGCIQTCMGKLSNFHY